MVFPVGPTSNWVGSRFRWMWLAWSRRSGNEKHQLGRIQASPGKRFGCDWFGFEHLEHQLIAPRPPGTLLVFALPIPRQDCLSSQSGKLGMEGDFNELIAGTMGPPKVPLRGGWEAPTIIYLPVHARGVVNALYSADGSRVISDAG
ncbi:hypothetical protein SUGI_1498240 [Cryptomeria japonica]|uniref:Uncharacterized protein n=1 Tax=Cryptomeria japonica TaxID=3369 RepID=A0AAD3NTM6_CRYJA|nr:hypothetical protein SUGI_1498240 [Cryptomeria japonica]